MEHQEAEVEWPVGLFRVEGDYYLNEEKKTFCLNVQVDAHDYDDDTGFPDDEFDRIIQEGVAKQLPEDHTDLECWHIDETEEENTDT